MLTDEHKVEIRRHLNYGVYGEHPENSGYRFFTHFGQLEWRMNNLSPEEERILLGSEIPDRPVFPKFVVPGGCQSDGNETIIQGFLPIIQWLESQMPGVSDNLDTLQAGEWKPRQNELPARAQLYNYWVRRMAAFLYLPVHEQPWTSSMSRVIN